MKRSLITVASITYAQKAQRILTANNIPSTVVKLPAKYTQNGCSFAVSLATYDAGRATLALDKAQAPYKTVISDE